MVSLCCKYHNILVCHNVGTLCLFYLKNKQTCKPMHIKDTVVQVRPNYNLLLTEEYYNHEYS